MLAVRARLAVVLAIVSAVALWLTIAKLRLSPDLSPLFPDRGEAAALARYARAFGPSEIAMVLVRGASPDEVEAAARDVADALRTKPSVARVVDRAPPVPEIDPTLAWAYAGPAARERLAATLTVDGMRARLEETRALLLAPGASEVEAWLARDPLRLAAIPFETRTEVGAALRASADGAFVTADGRARLVAAQARGSSFESASAATFVADAESAMRTARGAHPGTVIDIAGGHAIAQATEAMMKRDLRISSMTSLVLSSIAFLIAFRRARALVAVLPPLALGTLWTTALAAMWPGGLSVIAIAFAAVVVGVGVDTGVHVYAALLEARRRGLAPDEAADEARRVTWRPTLTAAIVAGVAFAALALSDLVALKQLGILCGAGEVLTAIAILLVTPEIGRWLERGAPPAEREAPWTSAIAAMTSTKSRALVAIGAAAACAAALAITGGPRASDALVAIRPAGLAPLATQDAIYERFGGRPGQWIVLSVDADAERARAGADAIADALEPLAASHVIDGYDALSAFAPSAATRAARLAARDALDLPALRARLESTLRDVGFDVDACGPALDAFAHPASAGDDAPSTEARGALAWIEARHVAHDGADTLVATYVRPTGDASEDARALAAIHAANPRAVVTGYAHLERELRTSLARDLPRVGMVALGVAAIALGAALRRPRDVVIALGAVLAELAVLGLVTRALGIGWHVYDALVVPVLIGVTLDESMFLLFAASAAPVPEALRVRGPHVFATALTTACGFGALVLCRYRGLADVGAVGALGVMIGLAASLVLVPAGLRVWRA
jgi:predicted RND superfamily exporter protein